MKRTRSAGGVVMNGDRVAVVNQHGNSWSLPKGHVEENETAQQAAEREIHEECGLTRLCLIRDLGVYERFRIGADPASEDPTERKEIRMFLYRTDETELRPGDPHVVEARWVDKGKVADLLTHPKDREFFRNLTL